MVTFFLKKKDTIYTPEKKKLEALHSIYSGDHCLKIHMQDKSGWSHHISKLYVCKTKHKSETKVFIMGAVMCSADWEYMIDH
jgi:hypothetical protein